MRTSPERRADSSDYFRLAVVPMISWLTGVLLLAIGCTTRQADTTNEPPIATSKQALALPGQCVHLPAVADAMLSSPPMDKNFGGMPIMRAGGKDEALVEFDLSSVSA
jgi:hypothetical protein